MKTKTPFNIADFIPANDDIQYAGQISDHPLFPEKIGRILVVTKYFPDADNQRLSIFGYLVHVDLETNEKVNSFKDCLEDWIITNGYKVVLRDAHGFMIPNPDFVPEDERLEEIEYTEPQLTPYKVLPAYIRFSRMLKTYNVNNQIFFQKTVDMEDEFSGIFDVYGNIQEYLLNKPMEFVEPVNPISKETN